RCDRLDAIALRSSTCPASRPRPSSSTRRARKGRHVRPVLLVLVLLVAPEASAQLPGFRDQAPTPPATTSRPASASGGAGSPSGGSPFLGGVPSGTATAPPPGPSVLAGVGRGPPH